MNLGLCTQEAIATYVLHDLHVVMQHHWKFEITWDHNNGYSFIFAGVNSVSVGGGLCDSTAYWRLKQQAEPMSESYLAILASSRFFHCM